MTQVDPTAEALETRLDLPEEGESFGVLDGTEQMLREALRLAQDTLVEFRKRRDGLNADIRRLVAEEVVLRQSLGPFTRAHKSTNENGEKPQ